MFSTHSSRETLRRLITQDVILERPDVSQRLCTQENDDDEGTRERRASASAFASFGGSVVVVVVVKTAGVSLRNVPSVARAEEQNECVVRAVFDAVVSFGVVDDVPGGRSLGNTYC